MLVSYHKSFHNANFLWYNKYMKTCATCKESKEITDYHKDKTRRDGYHYSCKSCTKKYREANKDSIAARKKRWYYKNQDVILAKARAKNKACPEIRALYRKKNNSHIKRYRKVYQAANKKRISAYYKKYREENANKVNKARAAWKKANPERVNQGFHRRRAKKKLLPHGLTIPQWQETLDACNHKCVYCGTPWKHRDHFVPLSKEGGFTVNNILPACVECNTAKGALDPFNFIKIMRSQQAGF